MEESRLTYLVGRYADNIASEAELDELFGYIRQSGEDAGLKTVIMQVFEQHEVRDMADHVEWTAMFEKIVGEEELEEAVPMVHRVHFLRKYWWAAAVLILLAGAAVIFNTKQPNMVVAVQHDLKPGHSGAILTLSDGREVVLDSTANGNIAIQGNAQVIKKDGIIQYEAGKAGIATEIVYNTIRTPKGRQISLVLPDGSKVWLNAASSVTYPTAFTEKTRAVTITGEAYFEVAHNASQPFQVKAGGQTIEDIGTAFNVNAYTDEVAIKTTLIEGAVKVNSTILKPGEQASLDAQNNIKVNKDADIDEVTAWKNGSFRFSSADIHDIMRQAARWYDVEIEYKGEVNETFTGGISRNVNASQLLHILESTNKLKFTIDGKKIIVEPVK